MCAQTKVFCYVCRRAVGSDALVTYYVERSDQFGPLESANICSIECLALLAVGDSRLLGEAQATGGRGPGAESTPSQKRWWRR